MPITPLPTAPSRDRPATFVSEANAFLGAMPNLGVEINTVSSQMMQLEASTYAAMTQAQQASANAAASVNSPTYTGFSVSSLSLSFGEKTLTVDAGKNWNAGMQLQLWAGPSTYMSGMVTSYSGTTLIIYITSITGSGTFSAWAISVLPSLTGLTSTHVTTALGYEPVKPNGTGASGTWNINIAGNANTVTAVSGAQVVNALGYQPARLDGVGAAGTWNINVVGMAGGVAWSNVVNRPTTLSEFANNVGYITAAGRSFPRRADGGDFNVFYNGQGGQPAWVLGSNDGVNWYVWSPPNFSVNTANTATVANFAQSVSWSSVGGRPTALSQFTNDMGFMPAQWVIDNFFNVCDVVGTVGGSHSGFSVNANIVTGASLQDLGGRVRLLYTYSVPDFSGGGGS
jgi:hypothetical protein